MPRIRTIKPEFFRHELLQDLEAQHPKAHIMLVYAGLWTQCDGNGVFRDRPRTLKLDILPFLNFDIDKTIGILEQNGLVQRYEHDGERYGCVPQFREHQRITGKEATEGEKYPLPPKVVENKEDSAEQQQGNTGETPVKHPDAQERKGKEKEEERNGVGAELESSLPEPAAAITLPLNTGEEFPITQQHVSEYQRLYPSVDVTAELRKMRAWCISNPKKRKTRGGVLRFVNGWLSSEQDRGGRNGRQIITPGKSNGRTHSPDPAQYAELARELGI